MAESGRRVLQYVADNEFRTGIDPVNFQVESQAVGSHAEAWIAAYRLTPEGRQFPGVTRSLRWAIGLNDGAGQRVAAVG
jgi:hypothetical protein